MTSGVNLYEYAESTPLTNVNPSGLSPVVVSLIACLVGCIFLSLAELMRIVAELLAGRAVPLGIGIG